MIHPKASRETPNQAEEKFLSLAYNRFYDIMEIVFDDDFWLNSSEYCFNLFKDAISIYSELLHYEPIKWYHDHIRTARPPMEAELSADLMKFIRNVILHFPFFKSWDEVFINKMLVNWQKPNQSIDKFLKEYAGKPSVKYRYWKKTTKTLSYIEICFPSNYDDRDIYLKDIVKNKEGVEFLLVLMRKTIDSQVESMKPKEE